MRAFNDNKAGMSGLDKEKIERIIAENTSANFGNHSLKRRQRIEERTRSNRRVLESLKESQIEKAQKETDLVLSALEAERDLNRVMVHIDMDAYFAAVEMRDRPELRSIPMAVGGDSMLSTSNYVARRFGVRAAMPGFIARKLCPELTIVRGSFEKYRRESRVFRKIFAEYDPNVRMGSLDEACLDISNFVANRLAPVVLKRVRYDADDGKACVCRLPVVSERDEEKYKCRIVQAVDVAAVERESANNVNNNNNSESTNCDDSSGKRGDSAQICPKCAKPRRMIVDYVEFGTGVDDVVNEIRFRVEQATGLTCSAGIGANWMLSKVCSDMNKPNGQFRLANTRDTIVEFMRQLSIRKVSGIGAVTEALLTDLGIQRCGDLLEKRAVLRILFSELSANWFLSVAIGVHGSAYDGSDDKSPLADNGSSRKSVSLERTFSPINDLQALLEICRKLCDNVIEEYIWTGDIASGSAFNSSESDALPLTDLERSADDNDSQEASISFADKDATDGQIQRKKNRLKLVGCRSATLKIKFASFDTITRCQSVSFVIQSAETLFSIIEHLLQKELKARDYPKVRLLGVRLSRLEFSTSSGAMGTNVPPSTSTDADPSSHYAKQRTLTDFLMSNAPRKRKPVDGQQKDGDVVDLVELSSSSDSESNERVICEEITGNCATDDSKVDVNLVHDSNLDVSRTSAPPADHHDDLDIVEIGGDDENTFSFSHKVESDKRGEVSSDDDCCIITATVDTSTKKKTTKTIFSSSKAASRESESGVTHSSRQRPRRGEVERRRCKTKTNGGTTADRLTIQRYFTKT